jgi:hypothetical protein
MWGLWWPRFKRTLSLRDEVNAKVRLGLQRTRPRMADSRAAPDWATFHDPSGKYTLKHQGAYPVVEVRVNQAGAPSLCDDRGRQHRERQSQEGLHRPRPVMVRRKTMRWSPYGSKNGLYPCPCSSTAPARAFDCYTASELGTHWAQEFFVFDMSKPLSTTAVGGYAADIVRSEVCPQPRTP